MAFIVAECGVNFSNMDEAEYMILAAKRAGADAVKFQIYNYSNLLEVFPSGDVAHNSHYDELMNIRIDEARLKLLKDLADDVGIEFIATPMYLEAVKMLEQAEVKRYKIRYADRNNDDLLKAVQATGKPIIISCNGWGRFSELPMVVATNLAQFTFMYCIPEYPPDIKRFKDLPDAFTTSTFNGYSNHYPSIIPPLIAATRGAEIIEVHVKLSGTFPIDDAVSIDMFELKLLCQRVREIEEYL